MTSRGEQMLALRRARMASSPPFLRGGFRPFFFGGAVWAVVALALWLAALSGGMGLPSAMDPLMWHRHEMLFGFVGAVIVGFLLTAIPNWTGRLPIAGPPLGGLFALWAAGRGATLFSGVVGVVPAAVLDAGFYVLMAGLAGREVVAARNHNIPVVGLVLLLGVACAVDHAAAAGLLADADLGVRAAIDCITIIISVVGGRIVPSFTRNWMSKQGLGGRLPSQPSRFDLVVIGVTVLALLGWIGAPDAVAVGVGLLAAGLLQAGRLARWGGLRSGGLRSGGLRSGGLHSAWAPIVFVLHVGYAWVPLGLMLLGVSILSVMVPRAAAIHALTAGAMGTMTLAVMTRATLGHTGRELRADRPTVGVYLLVTIGAALRVAAGLGLIDYAAGLALAGAAWGGAFVLFLVVYGPMLLRAHVSDPLR